MPRSSPSFSCSDFGLWECGIVDCENTGRTNRQSHMGNKLR